MAGKSDAADMEAFVQTRGVGAFEHAVDETGVVWAAYGIGIQPAFVFLNDDGAWTVHNGAIGLEGLTEAVETLISS